MGLGNFPNKQKCLGTYQGTACKNYQEFPITEQSYIKVLTPPISEKSDILKVSKYAIQTMFENQSLKNAICYKYNNGLAEGSVNKIKLIKRIMYGRNSFQLLKAKLLLNEYFYQIN